MVYDVDNFCFGKTDQKKEVEHLLTMIQPLLPQKK